MKNSMKQIAVLAVLLATALCFTSSSEPGYDENGQDINECMTDGACPEGYTCINLPGSYLCEGSSPFQLEKGNGSGLFYYVTGGCAGILGICWAECTKCHSTYVAAVSGQAYDVRGYCFCGNKTFRPL